MVPNDPYPDVLERLFPNDLYEYDEKEWSKIGTEEENRERDCVSSVGK